MSGPQVIQMLDETIDWYRTLGIQQQTANEPSDLLILYDNRQTANQVIALAFDIARANTEILGKGADGQRQFRCLGFVAGPVQLQSKYAAQTVAVQAELASDQRLLKGAAPKQKTELRAKISELQGELDLTNARMSLLGTLSTFASQKRLHRPECRRPEGADRCDGGHQAVLHEYGTRQLRPAIAPGERRRRGSLWHMGPGCKRRATVAKNRHHRGH